MRKLTTTDFIQKALLTHENKYDYSESKYFGWNKKIYIICKKHGGFYQLVYKHIKGHGCKICATEYTALKSRKTKEEFIIQAKNIHGEIYNYDNVIYKNNCTNVEIICKKHGAFYQRPQNHMQGRGCPICAGESRRLSSEEFINKAVIIHEDIYDYSQVNYTAAKIQVLIICKKHGEFKQKPDNHLKGSGCPICKLSRGELTINKFLKRNNINYTRQYFFNDCRGKKRPLPFDFAIIENNYITKIIEFQGNQHYNPVKKWDGIKGLLEIQQHDIIKKKYCEINNIKLLQIPYWRLKQLIKY